MTEHVAESADALATLQDADQTFLRREHDVVRDFFKVGLAGLVPPR